MTGFEAFSLYESLKLHFSKDSYDYFKYNGKTNHSIQSFENRKDKYYFYKLSRKYKDKEELSEFLISNFLNSEKTWAGTLLTEEAEIAHRNRQKVLQSLSYNFENDCRKLFDEVKNPNDILKTNGGYPLLLTKTLRGEISMETLCLLNSILNFLPMWDKNIAEDVRWPEFRRKMVKYAAFLPKDVVKYKLILKKVIT
jgi:hypothetical protein